MPLEIMIDTKRKKGVMKSSTLQKMDELQKTIEEIPELSKPVSILNLVKYSNTNMISQEKCTRPTDLVNNS